MSVTPWRHRHFSFVEVSTEAMKYGLPPRLEAVASQVLAGRPMADIGTDHALLPLALVRGKTVPSAVAMDVASGPLQTARRAVRGYEHAVEVRFSDASEKRTSTACS